jgi:hypothetical protein
MISTFEAKLQDEESSFMETGVMLNSIQTFFHNLLAGDFGALPQFLHILNKVNAKIYLSLRGKDRFIVIKMAGNKRIQISAWKASGKVALEFSREELGRTNDWGYFVFSEKDGKLVDADGWEINAVLMKALDLEKESLVLNKG